MLFEFQSGTRKVNLAIEKASFVLGKVRLTSEKGRHTLQKAGFRFSLCNIAKMLCSGNYRIENSSPGRRRVRRDATHPYNCCTDPKGLEFC
jgi:hypothetical protein